MRVLSKQTRRKQHLKLSLESLLLKWELEKADKSRYCCRSHSYCSGLVVLCGWNRPKAGQMVRSDEPCKMRL